MQTKHLILLVTIAVLLSVTVVALPTHAMGEAGTATLNVYTDPEKTKLVELDSNGRYYVVPGTEYYFKVSDITEYNIGVDITVWAYRTNTAENIAIDNFKVNSVPFNVIFNWIIPDDWLDEVVKIKYGTNLENDWFYAQKEIMVNARVGEGILYVYTDSDRTTEAPLKADKHYLVLPNTKYYFTIEGITEYTSTTTTYKVWARYQDTHVLVHSFSGAPAPYSINFDWTIPDLPVDTEIRIKYGTDFKGSLEKWFYAQRAAESAPRLLFVIPEVFLGPLGAITALFSALGITSFVRRKRISHG